MPAASNKQVQGSVLALGPTTSTGVGRIVNVGPANRLTVQIVGGVGAVQIDASLNGANWTSILAATTFSTAGRTVSSTAAHLFTRVRPRLTLQGSTVDTKVYIATARL